MIRPASAVLLALLLAACNAPDREPVRDGALAGTDAQRPAKLGLCIACHGETGMSRIPGTPHIAGQDEAYLRRSLTHYREHRRQGGAMNAAAGSLSNDDIRELAAWYARREWLDAPVQAAPTDSQGEG